MVFGFSLMHLVRTSRFGLIFCFEKKGHRNILRLQDHFKYILYCRLQELSPMLKNKNANSVFTNWKNC